MVLNIFLYVLRSLQNMFHTNTEANSLVYGNILILKIDIKHLFWCTEVNLLHSIIFTVCTLLLMTVSTIVIYSIHHSDMLLYYYDSS